MVSSDTWTRVPRDDFVILKTFNFDHAQIFPLVSAVIVPVPVPVPSFFFFVDNIFEGIKPLMKNNSSSAPDLPGPSQRPSKGAPEGDLRCANNTPSLPCLELYVDM